MKSARINLARTLSRSLLLTLLPGCASHNGPTTQTSSTDRSRVMTMAQSGTPSPDGPKDALPPTQTVFQVDVYQLTVPLGTFSRNEDFWKRMDEQCVDPTTYDLLYKNGIRVGVAGTEELTFFRKFMDEKAPTSKLSTAAAEAPHIELEMAKDLPEQTLSQFDSQNALTMRDYDRCTNVLNFSFTNAPRKPNNVRVKLCPMVRSTRKHYVFTELNNERELQYVASEMLYDLNLIADVPADHFFIVMPSPAATASSSVGRAFLTRDGFTELQEQVILVVPHPIGMVPR